jgi:hypothetical protein
MKIFWKHPAANMAEDAGEKSFEIRGEPRG